MQRATLIFGFLALATDPALSHPHVWVDAGVEVILNDRNEATGVRVSWTYDDLFSLYIIGDMGLDPDGDGSLTTEEAARLSGFDMDWDPDFPGDAYAFLGEAPLALSRPSDWTAGLAAGKITSTHLRHFEAPVPLAAATLILQVYDPGYFTAYSIPDPPRMTGGKDCSTQTFVPDQNEAQDLLKAALSEYAPGVDLEGQFPAVGAQFAEEVRVTCPAP